MRQPSISKQLKVLEMTDTGFTVPASKRNRLPPMYFANPQTDAMDMFDGQQNTQ